MFEILMHGIFECRIAGFRVEKSYFNITSVGRGISSEDHLSIFPNPAEEYIEISMNQPSEGLEPSEGSVLAIYDVLGDEVVQTFLSVKSTSVPINRDNSAGGGQIRLDISHLPRGVYFVRIGDKVQKVVKK